MQSHIKEDRSFHDVLFPLQPGTLPDVLHTTAVSGLLPTTIIAIVPNQVLPNSPDSRLSAR